MTVKDLKIWLENFEDTDNAVRPGNPGEGLVEITCVEEDNTFYNDYNNNLATGKIAILS